MKKEAKIIFNPSEARLVVYGGILLAQEAINIIQEFGLIPHHPVASEAVQSLEIHLGHLHSADAAIILLKAFINRDGWDVSFALDAVEEEIPSACKQFLIAGFTYFPVSEILRIGLTQAEETSDPAINFTAKNGTSEGFLFLECLMNPHSIMSLEHHCPGIVRAALAIVVAKALNEDA